MRTEEWTQDQGGMISTALVDVYEPGDVAGRMQSDMVLLSRTVFAELATAAGFTHAGT